MGCAEILRSPFALTVSKPALTTCKDRVKRNVCHGAETAFDIDCYMDSRNIPLL